MGVRKYTKEVLEPAIKSSRSLREAMRKCGVPDLSGGNHYHIAKLVKRYGISTAHFLGQGSNKGVIPKTKKTAKDVLVFHADQSRQRSVQLTRALLEIGREYKCFKCGLHEWRRRKLVLEIEHKDGDFQNDRESNLEFICPNCHSQTETFCRVKTSRDRHTVTTKAERRRIEKDERRHRSEGWWRTQDRPHKRKVERPSVAELQAMLQTMPMVKIGDKYGVSDNAIRKWAKRYGLPVKRSELRRWRNGSRAGPRNQCPSDVGVQVSSSAPVL